MTQLLRSERSAFMRDTRATKVLSAAIEEAKAVGYRNFTRRQVAERAGVAAGSVNHAFGTMDNLRDAVMREAIVQEITAIVRQGLADGHPAAHSAPPGLKHLAMQEILAG